MSNEDATIQVPGETLTTEEEGNGDRWIILLLLLLLFALLIWLYKRRQRPAAASELMAATQEEIRDYKLLFNEVDANGSGHITTTDLLKAFKKLNVTPRGDRLGRQIGILDVEKLRKKVDVDKNILIEFDEFVNIFKLEKLDFAEKMLKDADAKGMKEVNLEALMEALKKAGFDANENWAKFITRFGTSGKSINYEDLLQSLESAVIPS